MIDSEHFTALHDSNDSLRSLKRATQRTVTCTTGRAKALAVKTSRDFSATSARELLDELLEAGAGEPDASTDSDRYQLVRPHQLVQRGSAQAQQPRRLFDREEDGLIARLDLKGSRRGIVRSSSTHALQLDAKPSPR